MQVYDTNMKDNAATRGLEKLVCRLLVVAPCRIVLVTLVMHFTSCRSVSERPRSYTHNKSVRPTSIAVRL